MAVTAGSVLDNSDDAVDTLSNCIGDPGINEGHHGLLMSSQGAHEMAHGLESAQQGALSSSA